MCLINKNVFRSGGSWVNYDGSLTDISVGGTHIWGVNAKNEIYRKVGSGGWTLIGGKLKQVCYMLLAMDFYGINDRNLIYESHTEKYHCKETKVQLISEQILTT